MKKEEAYQNCQLCPRRCKVNRLAGETGFCKMTAQLVGARAGLHHWEEPFLSGNNGSGTVFFTGCNLKCIFCQNREITLGRKGKVISVARLAQIFLELQEKRAHNINLVTGVHYIPHIAIALQEAKRQGLTIPVVYNSSGYESIEGLRQLEGLIDIYLPDFKYMSEELAKNYSHAADYPACAKAAIAEMVRQVGNPEFDADGMMRKGVVVRHLVLPGSYRDSIQVVAYLYRTYGEQIFISIMNQYTPVIRQEHYPVLNRKLTTYEYRKVIDFAEELGIKQGLMQVGKTAAESFIPAFDGDGI